MKAVLALSLVLFGLAACGVDGPPQPPGAAQGLQITGTASAGISGSAGTGAP